MPLLFKRSHTHQQKKEGQRPSKRNEKSPFILHSLTVFEIKYRKHLTGTKNKLVTRFFHCKQYYSKSQHFLDIYCMMQIRDNFVIARHG